MSVEGSTGQPGEQPEPVTTRFPVWFYIAATVGLVWTIVLIGVFAVKTNAASTITATLTGVVGLIAAVLGIFQVQLPRNLPRIGPKTTRVVVALILAADALVSFGWAGWSHYQATRDVDVLAGITLGNRIDVLPGASATLEGPLTANRKGIALVIQVADHNSEQGDCTPYTRLTLISTTGGNPGSPVQATPSEPSEPSEPSDQGGDVSTLVALPPGETRFHIDVRVDNIRDDINCGVDLSVASATLQNW